MHTTYSIKKECHNSLFTHVPYYPSISATAVASSEPHIKKKVFTISLSKKSSHGGIFMKRGFFRH